MSTPTVQVKRLVITQPLTHEELSIITDSVYKSIPADDSDRTKQHTALFHKLNELVSVKHDEIVIQVTTV